VSFGEFDALFTGDAETIWDTLSSEGQLTDIEYLKVPHHGSKNGLTKSLLDSVTPEIAVISSGRKNSYGHPHKESLNLLQDSNVNVYRTDELGDVEVVSDGKRYWIEER
jgi:competence protein ComEC